MEFKPLRNKDLRKYSIVPIRAIKLLSAQKIPQTAFNTLVVMCSYTDRIGRTWVSQQRLADELGKTRETINRNLKKLRDVGLVTRVKKQFKDQPTTTYRVIYEEGIITEDDARGTLNARELIELSEMERELTGCDAQNVTENKEGVTPRDHRGSDAIGSHKRDNNDIYNNNIYSVTDGEVRKFCNMFKNFGQTLGQPRTYNLKDEALMRSWIAQGLTHEVFLNILNDHYKYCRDNRRPIAHTLAYFKKPIENKLLKTGTNPKLDNKIKDIARKLKA
jgi:DNA-binding transcriptional ArsR family regulator